MEEAPANTEGSEHAQLPILLLGDDKFDTPEVESLHKDLQADQTPLLPLQPSIPQEHKLKVR